MSFIDDFKKVDKIMSKYTPIFFMIIYGGICGAYFVGGDNFFDIIPKDILVIIVIGFILTNQAIIVSFLTYYKEK